jgi:N-acetylmuramic acid 6-phosphate etherase
MVRLGHVYGNLMVNVQPTNQKLQDRARRIIQEATGIQQATGVTYEQAADLLERAGRSVRVAIIMQKKQISRGEAEMLLARSKGRIREALKAIG